MDLKRTHEAYKFVMVLMQLSYLSKLLKCSKNGKPELYAIAYAKIK
jgi:hypothetical protein